MSRLNPWKFRTRLEEEVYDELFFRMSNRERASDLCSYRNIGGKPYPSQTIRKAYDNIVAGLFSNYDYIYTIYGIVWQVGRSIGKLAGGNALAIDLDHPRVRHLRWNPFREEPIKAELDCLFNCTVGPKIADVRYATGGSHPIVLIRQLMRHKLNCSKCEIERSDEFLDDLAISLVYISGFRSSKSNLTVDQMYRLTQWQALYQFIQKNLDRRHDSASKKAYSATVYDARAIDYKKGHPVWDSTYHNYYLSFYSIEDKKFRALWDVYRYIFKYVAIYRLGNHSNVTALFEDPFKEAEWDDIFIAVNGIRQSAESAVKWVTDHPSNLIYG